MAKKKKLTLDYWKKEDTHEIVCSKNTGDSKPIRQTFPSYALAQARLGIMADEMQKFSQVTYNRNNSTLEQKFDGNIYVYTIQVI